MSFFITISFFGLFSQIQTDFIEKKQYLTFQLLSNLRGKVLEQNGPYMFQTNLRNIFLSGILEEKKRLTQLRIITKVYFIPTLLP